MLSTIINGNEYPLATTLRVAYNVQGQFNHKSYTEVFDTLGEMKLEEQIAILFCAFKVANPDNSMTKQMFLDYYLDHYTLQDVMKQLGDLIKAITGVTDEEINAANTEDSGN